MKQSDVRIERLLIGETNCYLLQGSGGTVLIDPGPPGKQTKVLAGMEALGVRPEQIRLVLVTHGHIDHYGCAAELAAACGAPVAAYCTEPAFSRERRNALPPAQTLRGSLIRWAYRLLLPWASFRPLQADRLLEDGAELSAYGVEGQVRWIPGHSPGSVGLFTPAGDAFVGDLFVNYTVPSQPIYQSDPVAWRRSCERVRAFHPRTVYVGHGDAFPGEDLERIWPARYQFRWWVW